MRLPQDFVDLLATFAGAGAGYLVVGAYAVAVHSVPRFTKDIDLLADSAPDNRARCAAALVAFLAFGWLGVIATAQAQPLKPCEGDPRPCHWHGRSGMSRWEALAVRHRLRRCHRRWVLLVVLAVSACDAVPEPRGGPLDGRAFRLLSAEGFSLLPGSGVRSWFGGDRLGMHAGRNHFGLEFWIGLGVWRAGAGFGQRM